VTDPVQLRRDGNIAHVVLARPERGNAIDLATAQALRKIAIECDLDAAIRCVVLSAEGRLFCGGGDVHAMAAAKAGASELVKHITFNLHSAVATFMRMAKPLVTVIQGPAAGAGLGLAILGDIAIASRAAHFSPAYTALGLTPDGGASWLLPRLVGLRRAQEMVLTNQRLNADEAAEAGLVTRAVEPDALWQEADAMIHRLAAGATHALGRSRQLLLSSYGATPEAQLEDEARTICAAAATLDASRGFAAFINKRPPRFEGD